MNRVSSIDKTKLAIKIVITNGGGLLPPLYVAIFQKYTPKCPSIEK